MDKSQLNMVLSYLNSYNQWVYCDEIIENLHLDKDTAKDMFTSLQSKGFIDYRQYGFGYGRNQDCLYFLDAGRNYINSDLFENQKSVFMNVTGNTNSNIAVGNYGNTQQEISENKESEFEDKSFKVGGNFVGQFIQDSRLENSPITHKVTTTPKTNDHTANNKLWYNKPLFIYFIWPVAALVIGTFILKLFKVI